MSVNRHYSTGSRRHTGAAGGIRVRDTHTGAPDFFDPVVEGVPTFEAREGEQSQAIDIAPGAVDGGVHILPASLSLDLFAEGIIPPRVVDELPVLPDDAWLEGSLVFLTTDGKLYRNVADAWTAEVDGADILANSITAGQIAVGAIGADEIAAGAITTEKFHVGAKAPDADHADAADAADLATAVENLTAEVVIDGDGITVLNGKLFLQDYGGNSVLGPAGFSGSWVDYIAHGIYNAQFNAGALSSGLTAVGSGATYEELLSPDVPYWVVESVTGAQATYGVVDQLAWYRVLECRFGGVNGTQEIVFYQDVPVAAEGFYHLIARTDFFRVGTEPATWSQTTTFKGTWLDADRAAIGAEFTIAADNENGIESGVGTVLGGVLVAPARAVYLRLRVVFAATDDGSGVGYTAVGQLLRVGLTLATPVNKMFVGIWEVLGSRGYSTISTDSSGYIALDGGSGLSVAASQAGATGAAMLKVGEVSATPVLSVMPSGEIVIEAPAGSPGTISLYDDAAGAPGLKLVGGNGFGRIEWANMRLTGGGSSFPASPASNDVFYRTDLGMAFFWSSTYSRWLSTEVFETNFIGSLPNAGPHTFFAPTPFSRHSEILVEQCSFSFWGGSPNNGSNYWKYDFYYVTSGATVPLAGGGNSSGLAAALWVRGSYTVNTLVSSAANVFQFTLTTTGAPGAAYVPAKIIWRVARSS